MFKNYSTRLILTIVFLVSVLSCKDNIDLTNSIESGEAGLVTIQEARLNFETNQEKFNFTDHNNKARKKSERTRIPLWNLATEHRKKKEDGSNMLSIPLLDSRELGPYGNRRMLVFKEKKSKKLTYAVIEAFADTAYLKRNNYKFDILNFTGTLLVHDLEKGFESGFYMENGKPVGVVTTLKEHDDNGEIIQSAGNNTAGARKNNCIISIYEKCYGTKYQDANGQWMYSLQTCFLDRTERSPGCEDNYWPIWKNYTDFYNNGTYQSESIAKVSYLNNKLTVSLISRECLHRIVERIINSANPLSRLGSILQASQQSYDFYKFVQDLTSPQTNYKIYVTEGVLPVGIQAQTTQQQGQVTITFNSYYLSTATDLAVARTLTHELIHAYLIIGNANPLSFGPAFQAVYSYLNNYVGNDVHHTLMSHEYRTTISSMLNNYVNITNTAIPSYMGTMEDYTAKMAWQGLQGTQAYISLTDAEKQAIVSILTNEVSRSPNGSNKIGC